MASQPGDHEEAMAHAQRLAKALEHEGLRPRVWGKPGAGVRVYLGDQFVDVGRDGSAKETMRGQATMLVSALPRSHQAKYRAGMRRYLDDLKARLEAVWAEFERGEPKPNPVTGYHPDLLAREHRWPKGEAPAGARYEVDDDRHTAGETPIFVALEDLTPAQIEQLPVKAFTPDEWDRLDEDQQEAILGNDQESQERIDALVKIFVGQYEWNEDPDNKSDFSTVEDGFEFWLREQSDDLWKSMPEAYIQSILAYAAELGANAQVSSARYGGLRLVGDAADDIQSAINSAMEDSNRYDVVTGESDFDAVYSEERQGYMYLERGYYRAEWKALLHGEREVALKRIAKETSRTVEPDADDLDRGDTFEMKWETGVTIKVVGKWDEIEEAVKEALREQFRGDGASAYEQLAAAPPEQRVVHRWPDGFYVQDLLAEELPAEGATMGMCVGRPEMGYIKAVRNGKIKIMSLRRPSGKPLFTLELELDDDGKVTKIEQVKGKANRLPGFDRGQLEKPLKRDEVERVLEFIEGPLVEYEAEEAGRRRGEGIHFEDVDDLRPAAAQLAELCRARDAWAVKLAEKHRLDLGAGVAYDGRGPRFYRLGPGQDEEPRGNPAPVCKIHGERCGGFCSPYQPRRNPSRPGKAVRDSMRPDLPGAADERVFRRKIGEQAHREMLERFTPLTEKNAGAAIAWQEERIRELYKAWPPKR